MRPREFKRCFFTRFATSVVLGTSAVVLAAWANDPKQFQEMDWDEFLEGAFYMGMNPIMVLLYAYTWEILLLMAGWRTPGKLLVAGLISPYFTILCTGFGLMFLDAILRELWWIFLLLGSLNGGAAAAIYHWEDRLQAKGGASSSKRSPCQNG